MQVVCGSSQHTCAILSDATVWCWGSNSQGQLGDGTTGTTRVSPVQVLFGVGDGVGQELRGSPTSVPSPSIVIMLIAAAC